MTTPPSHKFGELMKHLPAGIALSVTAALFSTAAMGQSKAVCRTYTVDVAPIVHKYCFPCHLAESENPSGLSMDTYDMLMKGGEKGKPIVSGKPDESIFYKKLMPKPPFGKQMPRGKKTLTEEEIRIIREWIEQGALKE